MPVIADFTLVQLEDGIMTVTMRPPVAVGGWTCQFAFMRRFGGTPFAIKYLASGYNGASGITITDSGVGRFAVRINSVDSSGLDPVNVACKFDRIDSGFRTTLYEGYEVLTP